MTCITSPRSISTQFLRLSRLSTALLALSLGLSLSAKADETYSVEFGFVQVNTVRSQSFLISNEGPGPMKLKKIEIAGSFYSADSNCDTVVAVKGTCQLEIEFNPLFAGFQSGELELIFINPTNPKQPPDHMIFELAGTGQSL